MPRRQSIFEDLVDITAKLPWWVGVLLALASYLYFSHEAGQSITHDPSRGPASVVGPQLLKTFATFLQYIMPFVFGLGALLSLIARLKRASLHGSVAEGDSPAVLGGMSWVEFEMLVGEAYRRQGYQVNELGGAGPDGGVDLVLTKPGEKLLVQCKQWKACRVGVKVVRELYGVMTAEQATGGVVVISGRFTEEARRFAAGKGIDLVDGLRLHAMIKSARRVEPHLSVAANVPLTAGGVDEEMGKPFTPNCPRCGNVMVERVAKRGDYAGHPFWGCSKYPACRTILTK